MSGLLFACDIDNTLIYSHRHPHPGWPCVERLGDREQAFMSPKTARLYGMLRERLSVALVTSRSVEQLRRLRLPGGLPVAVAANGADLLLDGEIDTAWRRETDRLVAPWRGELERLRVKLGGVERYDRCRVVDDAGLFILCGDGTEPRAEALSLARETALEAVASGRKLYLLPPPLNKGTALARLMKRLGFTRSVAAGDSAMDLPMLRAADIAIAPGELAEALSGETRACPPDRLFSEFALETALEISERHEVRLP